MSTLVFKSSNAYLYFLICVVDKRFFPFLICSKNIMYLQFINNLIDKHGELNVNWVCVN